MIVWKATCKEFGANLLQIFTSFTHSVTEILLYFLQTPFPLLKALNHMKRRLLRFASFISVKKLGALFSKTMVATWPFKFCKYFQAEISQWMTSLWCRLLAHLNFFYSFETFPRIIFFWNSPNIIIFTSKAFNKNFALVGLDWWFAFWSNFSFLTSFILETSCLDERYIVGDSGNKQWIIDHLKNIGSIGCVWGNIRLTLKFLNLKFVQFIKIFFWYETLQLQKKKKAKYNLYTFEDHTSFSWILRQRQKWWLW